MGDDVGQNVDESVVYENTLVVAVQLEKSPPFNFKFCVSSELNELDIEEKTLAGEAPVEGTPHTSTKLTSIEPLSLRLLITNCNLLEETTSLI